MRWTLIDSAVVIPPRLFHDTDKVPGSSSNRSLSLCRRALAGRTDLSRKMVVLTCSLMLSEIWTSLRPNFLAAQNIVLWHKVLGEEVVKETLILPMMFAIVLLEYVAWLFLYIYMLTLGSMGNFSYRPQMLPLPEILHALSPLKD